MAVMSDSDSDSDGDGDQRKDGSEDGVEDGDGDQKKDDSEDDFEDGAVEKPINISGIDCAGSSESDSSSSSDVGFADHELPAKCLVDLYLLADNLLDPTTANMAIDKWIRMADAKNSYPSFLLVSYVYRFTIAGSPLRRLIRDWSINTVISTRAEDMREIRHPCEFMEDIIIETYALQRENTRGQICNVFSRDVMDGRPKDYYHQKLE